jgi:hypothetical protein
MTPTWYPDWHGQRAVIVASGPSAVEQPIDLVHGLARCVAINNSWRLAPFADVLYASDEAWWRENDHAGFAGLRVSRSDVDGVLRVAIRDRGRPRRDEMQLDTPGLIGAGGCSGFQALNLVAQFGATDIALVGFDARVDNGVHWHGKHKRTGNPTRWTAAAWVANLDAAASALSARGIRVVNCSPVSALTAYEKTGLEEWLGYE